jgi:hypothetical protein
LGRLEDAPSLSPPLPLLLPLLLPLVISRFPSSSLLGHLPGNVWDL